MSKWRRVAQTRSNSFESYSSRDRSSTSVKNSRKIVAIAKLAFLGVALFFVGSFLILPIFAFNLPSPEGVVRREGFATKVLDRNGEPLYDIFEDEKRSPVNFEEVPEYLKQATVAIEDKNFYKHQGFDPIGIARGFTRLFTRGSAQGGSTLTQQLVKNVLLNSERTLTRKLKEFILAIQIERKYSKDEILHMYLNEAPYGGTAWGVAVATELYFNKGVKDLNLIESAFLAGLPQRPSVYSPFSVHPEAYKERTKQVLRRMAEDGYISNEQKESALLELENMSFVEKDGNFKAPHFVQYVQSILEDRFGESVVEQGGLRVTTTLDLALQEKAQEIVTEEIAKVEKLHITNGAAVVINPETGEILAMVGSKDFNATDYDGQYNVTIAQRQPGSSIKPFTYVTALKKGYTPSTLIMDTQTEFNAGAGQPPYKPVNYDGKYRGPVQMRYALANSINVTAVKMLATVGVRDMLETAYDLGLNTLEPTKENLSRLGLSVTLGGGEVRLLELTSGYSAFVNQGYRVEPTAIIKVEDQKGKVLENNSPKKGKRVLKPEEAYLISDILSDNAARTPIFGPNSLLNIPGRTVMVKTGTTNEKKDNWTVGGNKYGMVGVWVGNNDNTSMLQVASGVTGASPIWNGIIKEVLKDKPNEPFEKPGGIVETAVDTVSGYAAHDGYPSRIEKFIDGTQPTGNDPVHLKMKVCRNEGKIATPSHIAAGDYEEKEFFVLKEDDPTAVPGSINKWQDGINAWIASQGDARYHPPTEFCGTSNPINVEFKTPKDRDSNLPNSFTVDIRPESSTDIVEVRLEADGNGVRTFNNPPYRHDIDLSTGVHKLKAIARDNEGHESNREITIGVGVAWDYAPSPTPTPLVEL